MEGFNKNQLMLGAGVVIIIMGIIGWFMVYGSGTPQPVATDEAAVILPEEEALVSDIAKTAETATLKDSIPTVSPTTNPVENIYKNPFE